MQKAISKFYMLLLIALCLRTIATQEPTINVIGKRYYSLAKEDTLSVELQEISDKNIGNSFVIKEGPIKGVEVKQPFYSTKVFDNICAVDRTICTRIEYDFYQTNKLYRYCGQHIEILESLTSFADGPKTIFSRTAKPDEEFLDARMLRNTNQVLLLASEPGVRKTLRLYLIDITTKQLIN